MELRLARTVSFPTEAVYAWWTDFREDDHLRPGSPARSVRTIERRSGNDVWLRDKATRPAPWTLEEHVRLDPPHGYTVEARYPGAEVRYAYRFDPVDRVTQISLLASVRPRGIGRILVPLTTWWWRRYAERDFDFHLMEMTRELEGSG